MTLKFTDDSKEVEDNKDKHVLVEAAVKQTGEIDTTVIDLIQRGNSKEAIVETEKEIVRLSCGTFLCLCGLMGVTFGVWQSILQGVLEMDEGGKSNVAGLLGQAVAALADLRASGASASNKKKVHTATPFVMIGSLWADSVHMTQAHHRAYMKKRRSICYDDEYLAND